MREHGARRLNSPLLLTAMVLASWLLLAASVWGAWVWAGPAGLRVLGLDLAEYVKFVAEIRSGQITLVREFFYLPLVALSLSLSLLAHRRELALPAVGRWLLNLLALPVALSMLPPAWTPMLLTTPEFVKQTIAIAVCVVAAVVSYPLLRHLPKLLTTIVVVVLAAFAAVPPIAAFVRLKPALDTIYGQPIHTGLGVLATAAGALLLGIATWRLLARRAPSIGS
jgi:hypothetical protein